MAGWRGHDHRQARRHWQGLLACPSTCIQRVRPVLGAYSGVVTNHRVPACRVVLPVCAGNQFRSYNAFVLRYWPGLGEQAATENMAAALSRLVTHAAELGIGTVGYSVWGSSADARMAANARTAPPPGRRGRRRSGRHRAACSHGPAGGRAARPRHTRGALPLRSAWPRLRTRHGNGYRSLGGRGHALLVGAQPPRVSESCPPLRAWWRTPRAPRRPP